MEQVEQMLRAAATQAEEPLRAMLGPILGGGKAIRPALSILVGRLFDAPIDPFLRLGVAVEMLHTATLVHDDIVDNAALRRRRPTLHVLWSPGTAVLAGDYLLAQSVSWLAALGDPRLVRVFARTLAVMCAGEIHQTQVTYSLHSARQDYYRSIEAKTASLFAATTEMAAMLARGEDDHILALRSFGLETGLAFQIVDDVLDLDSDEGELGKPAGSDLRQGLVTLPVLLYLESAPPGNDVEAMLAGQRDDETVSKAVKALRASGTLEMALDEAGAHARRGQAALGALPDKPARRTLAELARFVIERRH